MPPTNPKNFQYETISGSIRERKNKGEKIGDSAGLPAEDDKSR